MLGGRYIQNDNLVEVENFYILIFRKIADYLLIRIVWLFIVADQELSAGGKSHENFTVE